MKGLHRPPVDMPIAVPHLPSRKVWCRILGTPHMVGPQNRDIGLHVIMLQELPNFTP